MAAKEKAKELTGKFKKHVNPYIGSGMLSNTHDDGAILWQAKACATIAVDGTIEALKITIGHLTLKIDDGIEVTKDLKFWQDVKKEIEKL